MGFAIARARVYIRHWCHLGKNLYITQSSHTSTSSIQYYRWIFDAFLYVSASLPPVHRETVLFRCIGQHSFPERRATGNRPKHLLNLSNSCSHEPCLTSAAERAESCVWYHQRLLFGQCLRNEEPANVSENGEQQEIDPKIYLTYQTRAHTSHVWPLQQKEPSRVFDAVKGYCLANAWGTKNPRTSLRTESNRKSTQK